MKPTRRLIQFAFLAAVLIGVYVFGANCERWCPFGGVEAMYEYVHSGTMVCSLGMSNFYALAGVLVMTLLIRRAFCGYICPIGIISEWLHIASVRSSLARRLGVAGRSVPPAVDRVMSLMKYAVLAVILYFTWRAGELIFRGFDPCYALVSRHGTDITFWAYVVSGAIVVASLLIMMPFCRWFCPLAAVLNPLSRIGFFRVRRNAGECIDCGKCGKVCPTAIPVDRLEQVTAARCISCMQCVDQCPQKATGAQGTGALVWGPPRIFGRGWSRAVLVVVLLLCVSAVVAATYIYPLPSYIKTHGIEPAQTASVRLTLENLSCRGRANLLFFFLERDDMYELPGYFRLEAWPGPGEAEIRVWYDPSQTDEQRIKEAITEPYFEPEYGWRDSPFTIKGYDVLGLGLETDVLSQPH